MAEIEILAPAGSRESLEAAVQSGADAVYLGGKELNARRNAQNFDRQALVEAVSYCHVRGVRVYLTLNTLVFDGEMRQLSSALESACLAGVDGLLTQDLAAAALARAAAPGIPLHASTQMSIHTPEGARMLERLGFSRVVLARELSREQIAAVIDSTSLEVECFVHGALCMSVSGQCALSAVIGGRSGNRGLCAQPCRLPFHNGKTPYSLSLKDLTLIPDIRELKELGVKALKIEGRMKRPEYVAAAVTACRQALAGEPPDLDTLEALFSRSGFTSGYYRGKTGAEMFGIRRKEDVTAASGALRKTAGLYRAELRRIPLAFSFIMAKGEPMRLAAADRDGHTAECTGEKAQEAITSPTTPEKATALLEKTGGTPYLADSVSCAIDPGLAAPASAINELRRRAIEEITKQRARIIPHPFAPPGSFFDRAPYKPGGPLRLRIRLGRAQQFTPGLLALADELVLPARELGDIGPECPRPDKLLVELPRVLFGGADKLDACLRLAREIGITRALVGSLGGLLASSRHGLAPHGDYSLNIVNTPALNEAQGLGFRDMTLSFELERSKIRELGGSLPRGILAYGHLPLMITRNCPAASNKGCRSCGRSYPELRDRLGKRFFVDCGWQAATLYNCVPLFLADRLEEWETLDFITLYFTRESPEECLRIARLYRDGGEYTGEKTRGLYYRRVL